MKKYLLFLFITFLVSLVLGLSACGNRSSNSTGSSSSVPKIAKVRIWVTLSNNPDAEQVTSLTSAQTVQASIWARGTTEGTITFKVNLNYGDKFTTLANGIRTEGSSKAVSVGALSTPLQPGTYTFQAISGAFGEIVGSSSEITVMPDTSVNTTTTTPASTLSEQPDKAIFNKYFSNMGLGKIPPGGQLPIDLQQNATVFTQGDQISLYFSVIQEVQVRTAIYDVVAKKVVKEGGLPGSLTPKNYAGAEPLTIPAGTYEYKVYTGDVLVAVFPFEVR